MNKNKNLYIAFILPILIVAGLYSYKTYQFFYYRTIILNIEGYDPRDYIAGHYIQFSIDYKLKSICSSNEGLRNFDIETCLCLKPDVDGSFLAFNSLICAEASQICDNFLRGSCRDGRFSANIERLYVDEYTATDPKYRTIPKGSKLHIKLNSKGDAMVDKIIVNGVTIKNKN